MPYDYHKYCPMRERKVKYVLGIIIYIGLIVSVYTLASVYL